MSTLYVNNIEPVSGSALTLISASLIAVDDLTVTSLTSSFQGDLQGTASFATTASHALNSTSPSGVSGAIQFSDGSAFASDAANLFWDDTNNRLGIGTNAPTGRIQIVTDDAVNPQAFSNQTSLLAGTASQGALISAFSSTNGAFLNSLWPGNAWLKFNYGGLNHNFSVAGVVTAVIDSNTTFGNGTTSLGARVGIKGSGTTSATTSLLVQNSAGTEVFKVTDDGSATTINFKTTALTIQANQIFGSSGIRLRNTSAASGGTAVSTSDGAPSNTMLYVKGFGSTSDTTSLLVQNSAGTEAFKVRDDGVVDVAYSFTGGAARMPNFIFTSNSLYPTSGGSVGKNDNVNQHISNIYSKGVTHITDNTTSSTTLDASAKLQVDSTTQGFLPPRMTTTQKNAISSPASGLMVYDTDTNKLCCYNGTSWNDLF